MAGIVAVVLVAPASAPAAPSVNRSGALLSAATESVAQAMFSDVRNREVVLPGNVDSLSAADVNTGTRWWWFSIYNNTSAVAIGNASISVDGSTLPWSPAVTFPRTASTSSIPSFTSLDLMSLGRYAPGASSVSGQSISTGFDVSRTVSPRIIPPGGATQTVSITITPRDLALAGQTLSFDTWTDFDFGGTQIDPASVSMPAMTHGEYSFPTVSGTFIFVSVGNVQLDTPYTLGYQVWVPNTTPGMIDFAPGVKAEGFSSEPLGSTLGTSRTITDADLGGTLTMASSDPVQWDAWANTATDAVLSGRTTNSIPLDHFSVQITTSPVNAGAPTGVRVTALDSTNHDVASYPGPVELRDADGNTLAANLTWAGGVGTGTVTFAAPRANQTLEAADSSGINYAAVGVSPPFEVYGPLDHFSVVASPATGPLVLPILVTVTARDAVGHVVAGYIGAGLTLSDSQHAPGLVVPSRLIWWHGRGIGVVFATRGIQNDTILARAGPAIGTSGLFSRAAAPSRR